MIVSFSIQNIGSIKDKQTLSFEADKSNHLEDYYVIQTNGLRLLKLGLIYGANASGKTTILKALDFLRTLVLNPKREKMETFNFEPFRFDENTPYKNTLFELEFIQSDTRYLYEIELSTKAIVREELYFYNPNKANVFKRTSNLIKQTTEIKFGNKIKIDRMSLQILEKNTLWNNTVLGGFLKINEYIKELKDILDWFSEYLNRLIQPDFNIKDFFEHGVNISNLDKNTMISILKKADLNISNFYIKENEGYWEFVGKLFNLPKEELSKLKKAPFSIEMEKRIRKEMNTDSVKFPDLDFEHTVKGKKYLLPFDFESRGTQRYYTFACLLYKLVAKSILLPIDELESSLHPDLFTHFLLSFLVNSKKSQLIATTHNREILNNKDIFRNDVIWITDKDNEEYATELYSLADFNTSVIRDTTNIYNAYKSGKLGGTPNLGSYYINVDNENE
ncbi:MAG: ATP-binding protein [Prevotella sp.]|jgi:AAA15 family ATPase/GTPase|nr:ATP-binding protein [Prevotella sp.]